MNLFINAIEDTKNVALMAKQTAEIITEQLNLEGTKMSEKEEDQVEEDLFPGVNEVMDSEDDIDESSSEEVEETVEISEEALENLYREAMQLEVDVSKGFKEMQKPHEFGAGAKGKNQTDPSNLLDYESGENQFDKIKPDAAQDYSVKEIKKIIRAGIKENRALDAKNAKLTEMVRSMHNKLSEMNLLNSKIMAVNSFLTRHKLTSEQKKAVVESVDKGKTIQEVKRIYSILENSFKVTGVSITESARRAPRADAQKKRSTGTPDRTVLREQNEKKGETNEGYSRWKQLAGLVNG